MDEKAFRYLVADMRAAQDEYFDLKRERSSKPSDLQAALVKAKQLEHKVDVDNRAFDAAQHAPLEQQAALDFDL